MKGQAVADFFAKHLVSWSTKLYKDLLDEISEVYMTQTFFKEQVWKLFFDGSSKISPKGNIITGVGVFIN